MTLINPLQLLPATPRREAPIISRRLRKAVMAAAATGMLLAGAGGAPAAAAAILHLRCTNTASGASWPLTVDLDRGRVGSFPAAISKKWISWHDPQTGFFDLQRETGELQVRNASSTGGYFLHYQCRPD